MNRKKIVLVIMLLIAMVALVACNSTPDAGDIKTAVNEQDVLNQATNPPVETQAPEVDYGQDAMNEEGVNLPEDSNWEDEQVSQGENQLQVEGTPYPYTGATPVLLHPVDLPTPTLPPPIEFNYVAYNVSSLGLSFEGPANWVESEPSEGMYVLTDPVERDGIYATITITRELLNATYTTNDLKEVVKDRVGKTGTRDFASGFERFSIEDRPFGDYLGAYTDYRGTLPSGSLARGRFQALGVGQVLYTIELRHTAYISDSFMKNYNRIRNTLQIAP